MNQHVSSESPFYRGGLDDRKMTTPNGAIVNADYEAVLDRTWGQVRTIKVRDSVHTIVGYAIANATFIEGKTGLIQFDAGNNIGQGRALLDMVREVSDKPVVAVIYSHHHYTGGAKVFVEEGGSEAVQVFGHPSVDSNLQATAGTLGPMQIRRTGIQLGLYLPDSGPDAAFLFPEPHFEDPALNTSGHVAVNHPVENGEEVTIDGLKARFYHAVADTRDSLIVHFPELDLVLHNAVATPMMFSLYTLRGDFYRDPSDAIASLDLIRRLKPTYLVGVHGLPYSDGEKADQFVSAHRDTYAFDYNQSIRAINKGMSPDEMVQQIKLPPHLADNPAIFPGYIDNEYIIRGFYRGIVGWFAEDTADLHPPTPAELGSVIVEGFGGVDKLIARASAAFEKKEYNLAAKLMSFALADDPDNQEARQLKANALRAMAQATRSGIQTRNFMLTEALHLEGKLDWKQMPEVVFFGNVTVETILASPPEAYLKLLETKIDPSKSVDVDEVVTFTITDLNRSYGLAVRRGVAEFLPEAPAESGLGIEMPHRVFAEMVIGNTTVKEAAASGKAKVKGSMDALEAVINCFDQVKEKEPEPHHRD